MDNLTHSLVGLAAAKAGLERWSPAATTLCVLAANAPDADIITLVGGRWTYLHHHRGLTHSIVGVFALAILLPLIFYALDQLISRLRHRAPRIRLRGLLLASLIVSATHPLMDWTNSYGLRPLLPWSREWFYGDLVFIVDPWLWLSLGGAAFLLTARTKWRVALWAALALVVTIAFIFAPLGRASSIDPTLFRLIWLAGICAIAVAHRAKLAHKVGPTLALIALSLVVVYWGGLSVLQRQALARAQTSAAALAAESGEKLLKVAAMPTLGNPFHWQCIADTDRATYRFELLLLKQKENARVLNPLRYEKPQGCEAAALAQAEQDSRARIFLDFARFPASRVEGDCLTRALVQFADLRYTEPGQQRSGNFALEIPVTQSPDSGKAGVR